jgi:hypothetical protein
MVPSELSITNPHVMTAGVGENDLSATHLSSA